MKEHNYGHNQDIVAFVAFINDPQSGKVYYVSTDKYGKILCIYDLKGHTPIRGVSQTCLYLDYVVDIKDFSKSILVAANNILNIEKFIGGQGNG